MQADKMLAPKVTIPYARQSVSEADIEAVVRVLRSDFLTQGPATESFEKAIALDCGARHAIALANATAALHLACLAVGVGPGDVVWTSPNTFVASANCALYCGAAVDFVDIDPDTFNISVTKLAEKLEQAKKAGKLPRLVIPVHFGGQSADMKRIHELSLEYGFSVIEDASHAVGGSYMGHRVGSCVYSSGVVFSFHPVKIMTTGEGGVFVTNRDDLAERVRLLRSHGITRAAGQMSGVPHGPWYYEQQDLGYNYRMTDIQAALGESQLKRVDDFVARRNEIAERYSSLMADLPVQLPRVAEGIRSTFHLYVVRLKLEEIKATHRQVFEALHNAGVIVSLHYIPVYLQPYYRGLGFTPGHCPEAEAYYSRVLTLPLYVELTSEQQQTVVRELSKALGTA